MPYIVEVEYVTFTGEEQNTFGTFRTERAADRFAAEIRAWDDARPKDHDTKIRWVRTQVKPVTKPMLDFVQEDVARFCQVEVVSSRRA